MHGKYQEVNTMQFTYICIGDHFNGTPVAGPQEKGLETDWTDGYSLECILLPHQMLLTGSRCTNPNPDLPKSNQLILSVVNQSLNFSEMHP